MIGLTLVTLVAVLGAGLQQRDAGRDHRAGPRRLRRRRQRASLPFRAAEGDALARVAGRQGRLARPLRQGARGRQGAHVSGHRPGHDRALLPLRLDHGLRRTLGQLGADGAIVTKAYAEDQHLAVGRPLAVTTPSGDEAHARRARRSTTRRGRSRCSATSAISQAGVRRGVPHAQEQPHVPRRRRRRRRGDQGRGRRLRRRQRSTPAPRTRRTPTKDMATVLAMLYVLLGFSVDREPVRHGQHARALGVRAHA